MGKSCVNLKHQIVYPPIWRPESICTFYGLVNNYVHSKIPKVLSASQKWFWFLILSWWYHIWIIGLTGNKIIAIWEYINIIINLGASCFFEEHLGPDTFHPTCIMQWTFPGWSIRSWCYQEPQGTVAINTRRAWSYKYTYVLVCSKICNSCNCTFYFIYSDLKDFIYLGLSLMYIYPYSINCSIVLMNSVGSFQTII